MRKLLNIRKAVSCFLIYVLLFGNLAPLVYSAQNIGDIGGAGMIVNGRV